ncbi:MAG: BTAD domain-containing putative transcriptional regulator [Patulibacter minatonensis]
MAPSAHHPSPRSTITFRLLGPLAAERAPAEPDGRPQTLALGPPKQRAVLALLLLRRGRIVSTDQFIAAIWGEHPPPSVLGSLQAYISNLRRILRPSAEASSPIVLRGPGYLLDIDPAQVDVTGFTEVAREARAALDGEQWEAALALAEQALAAYEGELLDDFREEWWVQADASTLEELRTECREVQISALLALGRIAPAIAVAQTVRTAHPHRDRGCWLLMVALHVGGRSSEALDEFRRHTELLDDELGLVPSNELRDLEMAILRHDPELAAWPRKARWTGAGEVAEPRTPEPAPAAEPAAPESPVDDEGATLVGRARELQEIERALAEAVGGQVRWVVLTGPAGIGKTRLASELGARAAGAGAREAWARCSEEDGAPAWWPIRQIIRGLGHDPDALLEPPPGVGTDEARFVIYERVATLIGGQSLVGTPIMVAIDDIQWADRTSARCLAHLVGALRGLPLIVALTLRSGEATDAIEPLLAALSRAEGRRQLEIGPLDGAAVAELAGRVATDPLSADEAVQLAHHTGGNPLFVSEFARLPAASRFEGEAPFAVRSVLGRRVGSVDDEVLGVLRPAAVLGDVVDIRALSAVTQRSADALADLLDEAADARLLVPAPETGGYAFAHGLIRDELLAAMAPLRRQRWHARVADALAASTDADRISQRARHLVAAGSLVESADVIQACRRAAESAETRWSSEAAAEWWAEAVRAYDREPIAGAAELRDELVIAQLGALSRAGRGQSVLDVLDGELVSALRAGRAATVGRLAASLVRCAGAWPWLAYGDQPFAMLDRLASLRSFVADDAAASARICAALAVGHAYNPDPSIRAQLTQEALGHAAEVDDDEVTSDAVMARLIAFSAVAGHEQECLDLLARLRTLEHSYAEVDVAIGQTLASLAYLALGDVVQSELVVREAVAVSERLGLPVLRLQLRWMQGALAAWHGNWGEARRQNAVATRVHLLSQIPSVGPIQLAEHGLALAEGRMDEESTDETTLERDAWQAAIAAAQGDRIGAERHATAWLDGLSTWTWVTLGCLTLLGDVAADLELAEVGARIVPLLEPYAGQIASLGHSGLIGPVDLPLGRLRQLAGDRVEGERLLRQALELCERTGGHPWAERSRSALLR